MNPTPHRRRRWFSLVLGLLSLALLIGILRYLPTPINTAHQTIQPTSGTIALPPTVTPAP